MAKKKSKKLKLREIRNDPQNDRWVENMDEFGRAGKANRLFRKAFAPFSKDLADRYISGRLTKVMSRVVWSERVHERGNRTVTDGDLRLLEHFNFNRDCSLFEAIKLPGYEITFIRETGQLQLHIPSIFPVAYVNLPPLNACFNLIAATAAIDFDRGCVEALDQHTTEDNSRILEWTAPMQLTLNLPPGITSPVFIALGIQFFGLHNGRYMEIDKKYNAMEIVKVFA